MSTLACALPNVFDHHASPFARAMVRVSEHRWCSDFGAQLSAWAATVPTLVVLHGGRVVLSDDHSSTPFAEQVRSAWLASDAERDAGDSWSGTDSCVVLRFDAGADRAALREHAGSITGPSRAAAGAQLVVQLRPAAFFRFLCQRRALAFGLDAPTQHMEQEAMALLRHVLFHAWPCGQSRTLSSSPRRERHRSLAFEAQAAMSRALACRHPLDDLARSLDTSPFHLAHVFRSEIGISLHQYLVQLRLIAALERLAEGEPDLSKLALELGFSHHSHFSSQFRRVVGHSPRVVRRLLTAESTTAHEADGRA